MMVYGTFNMKRVTAQRLSEKQYYDDLLLTIETIKRDNAVKYQQAVEKYHEICKLASGVWNARSKELNYLKRAIVPRPPTFNSELKKLKRMRRDALRHEAMRVYRKDYKLRSDGAKGDLLAAGFTEWIDFRPYSAITDRKRLMEQVEGVWVRREPETDPAI